MEKLVTLHVGDCLDVLAGMEPASVDSIVTDPPYGLTELSTTKVLQAIAAWMAGDRTHVPDGRGFMGREWDQFVPPPGVWDECLRVLKPGGHLLAFAGARTVDLMTLSIRIAGFEIRDSIHWLYGSGFPKSLDVSKAIDRRADITAPATDDARCWQGWGTALKPAHEPIVLARKPLAGTVAGTVLAYGTGPINIDGCRVGTDVMRESRMSQGMGGTYNMNGRDVVHGNWKQKPNDSPVEHEGRWPTNLAFTHSAACDEATCDPDCPVAELNRQSGKGGASRFFPVFRYQAKAPKSERPRLADGTSHPTVKPVALMRWLIRLVTSPGGLVLDPFAGSGTTGEAAALEGMRTVLIEMDETHADLIRVRLSREAA